MKIIIFTSFYGSGYGLGYSAQKEAEELSKVNGNKVTVVYIEKDQSITLDKKITYHQLKKIKLPLIDIVDFYFKLNKNAKIIDVNSFDLIYIQSLEFGLFKFSKIKKPIFYFSRSTIKGISDCFEKNSIKISILKKIINKILIKLEKRIFLYSKKIFVKSEIMKNEVCLLYGVDSSKIVLITGGIDKQDFWAMSNDEIRKLKTKYSIQLEKNIILYAGRIIPQKGLVYLIKCLPSMILEKISFCFVVVGEIKDEKYFKKIKSLIAKNNLEKYIIFIGHVNQCEVNKFINLADVVASPSLYEPFGMINLQAAILGKKILISSHVGALNILSQYDKIKIISNFSLNEIEKELKDLIRMDASGLSFNGSLYSWGNVARSLLKAFDD
jgi:glycosyltransferase involved in cell wall biosynthesis